MALTRDEILEEAMQLPPDQQRRLVEDLYDSIQDAGDGLSPEWMMEIRRRLDDLDNGRVETIPGEQVMRELRERFGR